MDLKDFSVLSNGKESIAIRARGNTVEIWGIQNKKGGSWRNVSTQTKDSAKEAQDKALEYIRAKINNGYRWHTSVTVPNTNSNTYTAPLPTKAPPTQPKPIDLPLDRFQLIELE
jgi:hypothetical protein